MCKANSSRRFRVFAYRSYTLQRNEASQRLVFLRVTVFCTCGTYLELRVSCARSPRARPLPLQESRIPEETIIYHQRLVCSLLTSLVEGNRGNCSIFDPTRNPPLNNGFHADRGCSPLRVSALPTFCRKNNEIHSPRMHNRSSIG